MADWELAIYGEQPCIEQILLNRHASMQTLLLDVVNVQTETDYVLLLDFENGEHRRFDMKPYLHQKPWNALHSAALFNQAKIEQDAVVWPGEIDIDPEALYERSQPA